MSNSAIQLLSEGDTKYTFRRENDDHIVEVSIFPDQSLANAPDKWAYEIYLVEKRLSELCVQEDECDFGTMPSKNGKLLPCEECESKSWLSSYYYGKAGYNQTQAIVKTKEALSEISNKQSWPEIRPYATAYWQVP